MTLLRVAGPARRDIGKILRRSRDEFGPEAANRYRSLFDQALRDLSEDTKRPGVQSIDDVRPNYWVFHLKFSLGRVPKPSVRHPRHVIVFRIESDSSILVARVFHERQLLERHLRDHDG